MTEIIEILLFALAGVLLIVVPIALIRNNWVYKQRMKLINEDMAEFNKLQSYDYMMQRFWIWNIESFKR